MGPIRRAIVGIAVLFLAPRFAGAWTWIATGDLAGATDVHTIIQTRDGTILAATEPNGDVFRTDDGGIAWTNTADVPGARFAYQLLQTSDGYIYLTTDVGVFRTNDKGTTWSATAPMPGVDQTYVEVESLDGYLYVGTGNAAEVFRTNDGGATWASAVAFPPPGGGLVTRMVRMRDGTLWAAEEQATSAHVFHSADGTTWLPTADIPGKVVVCGLVQDAAGAIYLGTGPDSRVYKTLDGATWVPTAPFPRAADVVHGMLHAADGAIYAVTGFSNADVFRSQDEGASWTLLPTLPGATNASAIVQAADGWVYVGAAPNGDVFKGAEPTAIELVSFTATGAPGAVQLAWATATESDNAGFHIWRADSEAGAYARITANLIPSQGDPTHGASYAYSDTDVNAGKTYWYKLEDVDVRGQSTFHGPVSATVLHKPFFGCGVAGGELGAGSLAAMLIPLGLAGIRRRRRPPHARSGARIP